MLEPMATEDPGTTPLWGDRNFGLVWAGETLAQLGMQVGQIALPVIAIELLLATEFQVGALNAAGVAAFLLIGLPAGAWVDRWLKRRTMIVADLLRAGAVLAVPLLWWAGDLAMWHLYAVAGVIGWVGLVIPHLVRLVLGSDNRVLLPASALLGGLYLLLMDTLARSVVEVEIPVGILTAIIGAPVFVFLLVGKAKGGISHA